MEGYDVTGGGIVLNAEKSAASGTTFVTENLSFRAEIFDEFYYDAEKREITHVAETQDKIYKIGDVISTTGFSFDYPTDFDIILLSECGFVKIRGKKIISIGNLKGYRFEKVPLVNARELAQCPK